MTVVVQLHPPAGGVLVAPMSREEYDALPYLPRAEWWDGACVVTGATPRHARAIVSLAARLLAALEGQQLDVMSGAGWRLPDAEFVPDIAVARSPAPNAPEAVALFDPPLLVVEVLSPTTRHVDLGRKRAIYAAGGVPWYWVVDLVHNELIVLRNDTPGNDASFNDGGAFVEVQRITSGTTSAPVSISVDVAAL